ncbi:MAG TPA: energy transducer TonB [Steroidobacteraceae bacterium]|nr:energy transducer TonB [Steroidobacteraceae bacterium]
MPTQGQTSSSPVQERRDTPAAAAAGRRKDLYLLSGDDSLLLELGPLLGDRYRSRPIDAADQIEGASLAPWLLVIDATDRHDARAQAARIEQQHPLAPLLVICADGKATDWASPLARGMVSAVVERGSLATMLPEALMAIELRMEAAATAITSNAFRDLAGPDHPGGRARLWLWAGAALLFAGGAGWYFLGGQAPAAGPVQKSSPAVAVPATLPGRSAGTAASTPPSPVSAAPATTSAPAPVPHRTVLELLSDARVAFRDERTLLPGPDGGAHGDSALELYGAVLAQDPKNEEAREGMQRLLSVAKSRIQSDMAAGRPDDATRLVAAFRDAGIAPESTTKLQADIAAGRVRALPVQAREAIANGDVNAATQFIAQFTAAGGDRATLADLRHSLDAYNATAQLNALGARARTAISAGALLEPAGENGRELAQALVQLNPKSPLTLSVQHELQLALLARAQSASHATQFELAQQLLGAAADYGSSNELASARRQLQSDIDAARERTAAATAAAAAPPAVRTGAAVEPEFLAAKPVKPLSAAYPPQALQSGKAGYVVVEFLLDGKGRANKAKVVESSPPGIFDGAALAAVSGGRYDTSALGDDKAKRSRIRISFKP